MLSGFGLHLESTIVEERMSFLTNFLAIWLVTSFSLYVLSRLPTGIELEGFAPSLVAGFVLGLLNAFLRPVLGFIAFPLTVLSLGLFSLVLNGLIFLLAASLVRGFGLRRGCLTAFVGSILLSLLNALIFAVLP
jgi:putative membrane protein